MQAVSAENGDAIEPLSIKAEVIVDKADEVDLRLVAQRQRQLLPGAPGTINHHPAHVRRHHFQKVKQREPDAGAARRKQQQEYHWMENAQRPRHVGQAKYDADYE